MPKSKNRKKIKTLTMRALFIIWGSVLALMIVPIAIPALGLIPSMYYVLNLIIGFATFLATSFFSFSIYNHNASIRVLNDELRRESVENTLRAELFRELQFVASNYSIIDFVDHMTVFEESGRYVQRLKINRQLDFYLAELGQAPHEIFDRMDDFHFLTLRMPYVMIEGKTIGKIGIKTIKFDRDGSSYKFVAASTRPSSLILYDETEKRNECIVNLIVGKKSDFFNSDAVNPFSKIKIELLMESLLSVRVEGEIELYFTNPEKIEKTGIYKGANKYKILSSHFEVTSMPKLMSAEYKAATKDTFI